MTRQSARWDEDALYRQFLLRDSSLDGKFLTGVISTGIYCLPSCPARRPKRENVRFFHDPDEARRSGLRPCFRCRPDALYRGEEFHESLYEQTAARVRANPAGFRRISELSRAAGLSGTALNDLFREHAHESPASFLRRVRMEAACELIEKGKRPGDAAEAAGFESSSAFHEQFSVRTGMTPATFASLGQEYKFMVSLPKQYRTQEVLSFFGRDKAGVSERVRSDGLSKCFQAGDSVVSVDVTFSGGKAICVTDPGCGFAAHRAVIRMLGFESDGPAFERQFVGEGSLGALFHRQRGLRIPLTPTPWEALAWAIMGQQVSLGMAVTLRRGLIDATGRTHGSGLKSFPTPEVVAAVDIGSLRSMKFSASKADYLLAVANAVASGELPLARLREFSARHAARLLKAIHGVGPWTVQYVFLRGLGFADCLPAGDAGLAKGLERHFGQRPDERGVKERLERFAPFRSLASCHVWASLSEEKKDDN